METNINTINFSNATPVAKKDVFKFGRVLADFHNRTILFKAGRVIFVTYGLVAAIAFLVGSATAGIYGTVMGIDPWGLLAFSSFVLIPAVLIGSRAFSVLLEWRSLFTHPIQTLIKPGYMLHGGVFGGAAAIIAYSQLTGTSLFLLTDAFAFAMPLGEAIQRVGCHVYGCCWGKPTHSHFGISYTSPHSKVARAAPELVGKKLYPVQLYGTGTHLAQFLLFAALLPVIPSAGIITGLYLVSHPIIRVVLEQFRKDDRGLLIGPFTHTNLYSAIQFVIGASVLGIAFGAGQTMNPLPLTSVGVFITQPIILGFLGFNFAVAALAFGVHLDSVGNWYTKSHQITLNKPDNLVSILVPQRISRTRTYKPQ